jgi:hypothetical protein
MKGRPIRFTQQEVDALTTGGKVALAARRQLRTPRAAARLSSKPSEKKAAPARITKKEMAAIKSGRLPVTVRRHTSADIEGPAGTAAPKSDKAAPSVAPGPSRRDARRREQPHLRRERPE